MSVFDPRFKPNQPCPLICKLQVQYKDHHGIEQTGVCNAPVRLVKEGPGKHATFATRTLNAHMAQDHPQTKTGVKAIQAEQRKKEGKLRGLNFVQTLHQARDDRGSGKRAKFETASIKTGKQQEQSKLPTVFQKATTEAILASQATWMTYATSSLPLDICQDRYFRTMMEVTSGVTNPPVIDRNTYHKWVQVQYEDCTRMLRLYMKDCSSKVRSVYRCDFWSLFFAS